MGETAPVTKDPEQGMHNIPLDVDPSAPALPQSDQPSTDTAGNPEQPTKSPANELSGKLMGVFVASSAMAIFLWFMAGAGFPWFIYIVYGVGLICVIIYAAKTKDSFFANVAIFASTNFMLFITFLACGGGYPWFVMPLCGSAIFPVSQIIWKNNPKPLRGLYIHAAIYLLINIMLFFIWVVSSLHQAYPWFIYPWCGWGVLLLIQYNAVVMHDRSRLFVFISADLGIMLMITFRFAIGPLFMVFVFVAVVLAVVYYLFLRKGYTTHCWCMRRNKSAPANPAPQSAQGDVPSSPPAPQVPVTAEGYSYGVPQFQHIPLPPGYQSNVPIPPGTMYFSAGQTPYPYQGAPAAGPTYYAYFPSSNGQLYPTITTISTAAPPSVPVTVTVPVSVPVPDAAVLKSDVNNNSKEEENEDTHLLRGSSSRSRNSTGDQ